MKLYIHPDEPVTDALTVAAINLRESRTLRHSLLTNNTAIDTQGRAIYAQLP